MLEYDARPGDDNQPIFSPSSPSLLLPGSFPAVSSEIPSRGCVSSPGLGAALPHRNAIGLQPFICELEPFQEEGGIPGRLLAGPGSPASSQLPKCPAHAAGAPQSQERSHVSRAVAPLERTNPPLPGPVPCRLGLSPATSPTASDPCGYPPPASRSCQGRGGRWGRTASFAGGGDAGTASALLGEPLPRWRVPCHPSPPFQRSSQGGCCAQGSWFPPRQRQGPSPLPA